MLYAVTILVGIVIFILIRLQFTKRTRSIWKQTPLELYQYVHIPHLDELYRYASEQWQWNTWPQHTFYRDWVCPLPMISTTEIPFFSHRINETSIGTTKQQQQQQRTYWSHLTDWLKNALGVLWKKRLYYLHGWVAYTWGPKMDFVQHLAYHTSRYDPGFSSLRNAWSCPHACILVIPLKSSMYTCVLQNAPHVMSGSSNFEEDHANLIIRDKKQNMIQALPFTMGISALERFNVSFQGRSRMDLVLLFSTWPTFLIQSSNK